MSFNSARWDAFDRWSQDRLVAAPRRGLLPVRSATAPSVRRRARHLRQLELRAHLRLRLVPARGRRLASVLPRPLAVLRALRMDVGGRRRLGVADAPLRAVGHDVCRCLVLGAGPHVGSGLGALGGGAGLRQLVPARVRRPAGGALRIRARVARRVLQARSRGPHGPSCGAITSAAHGSVDARSGGRPPLHAGWRAPVRRCRPRAPGRPYAVPRSAGVPAATRRRAALAGVAAARAVWRCLEAPADAAGQTAAAREWGRDVAVAARRQPASGRPAVRDEAPRTLRPAAEAGRPALSRPQYRRCALRASPRTVDTTAAPCPAAPPHAMSPPGRALRPRGRTRRPGTRTRCRSTVVAR